MSDNNIQFKTRLYYIDWLRILVILSLIPFHAALTYSGLGDTYISNPLHDERIIPFMLIVSPLSNFFMTLLFLVSGIASFYAIRSKGVQRYISERSKKLLIPFAVGTIMLCPFQAYFKALHEGFSGNYFEFLPEFFTKMSHYMGYAHLWFLFYLFVFSIACVPLFARWKNKPQILEYISSFLCRGKRILIPMAFIFITEAVLRPFFPGKLILIGDWANDVVYLSNFVFGYVFASSNDIQEKINQYFKLSFILVPLCLAVFFYTFWMWAVRGADGSYLTILWACAKGVYESAAIIMFLGIGKRFLNKKSPLLSYLSKASFTYYLIHFVPVSLFTYVFIKMNLNVYLKFILAVVLSYIFIAVVYELFVRRLTNAVNR